MPEIQSTQSPVKLARTASPRTIISLLTFLFLPPILLFGAAGTIKWAMGWLYIILTIGGVILSRILVARVHPDLLAERSSSMEEKDVPTWDRKLVPLISTIVPLLVMLVAGLDRRFGWSPPFATWTMIIGSLIVAAAVALAAWAMVANRFFSAFVRVQNDRGQRVISNGPYAFMRHPGYTAGILVNLGVPLMLGSLWTFLPAMLGIMLVVLRAELEDRYLRNELEGYPGYTERVRWKLFPYLW